MTGDSGERLPEAAQADLSLPKVLDVKIRNTAFQPHVLRNFKSSFDAASDAVEFIVKTERPIPIRALGPVLYVGGIAVTEVTHVGPNEYRFVAQARKDLKQNAAIHLGWTGQPPAKKANTSFRFRI